MADVTDVPWTFRGQQWCLCGDNVVDCVTTEYSYNPPRVYVWVGGRKYRACVCAPVEALVEVDRSNTRLFVHEVGLM